MSVHVFVRLPPFWTKSVGLFEDTTELFKKNCWILYEIVFNVCFSFTKTILFNPHVLYLNPSNA